jgi:hypothetical protein
MVRCVVYGRNRVVEILWACCRGTEYPEAGVIGAGERLMCCAGPSTGLYLQFNKSHDLLLANTTKV